MQGKCTSMMSFNVLPLLLLLLGLWGAQAAKVDRVVFPGDAMYENAAHKSPMQNLTSEPVARQPLAAKEAEKPSMQPNLIVPPTKASPAVHGTPCAAVEQAQQQPSQVKEATRNTTKLYPVNATEPDDVTNRISLDTLPRCADGLKLVGKHCRKSA